MENTSLRLGKRVRKNVKLGKKRLHFRVSSDELPLSRERGKVIKGERAGLQRQLSESAMGSSQVERKD